MTIPREPLQHAMESQYPLIRSRNCERGDIQYRTRPRSLTGPPVCAQANTRSHVIGAGAAASLALAPLTTYRLADAAISILYTSGRLTAVFRGSPLPLTHRASHAHAAELGIS